MYLVHPVKSLKFFGSSNGRIFKGWIEVTGQAGQGEGGQEDLVRVMLLSWQATLARLEPIHLELQ